MKQRLASLGIFGVLLVLSDAATALPSQTCQVVHGRYEIYANGDRLRVAGSRHLLDVVIDALDKELMARGWENTAVDGDFTVCAEGMTDARKLTIHDRVHVTRYQHLRYKPKS